jgi:hypothetical protein
MRSDVVHQWQSREFATIPLERVLFGGLKKPPIDASSARLSLIQTLPSGAVFATTPQGVATLDIVFELRTGSDF